MTCPVCGYKTKVKDTGTDVDCIVRKRICLNGECKYVFYTMETECDNKKGKLLLNELRNFNASNSLEDENDND